MQAPLALRIVLNDLNTNCHAQQSTGLQCWRASIDLHSSYNSTCSADSSFRASTSMAGCRLCKRPGRHYNSEHFCHIVQIPSQLSPATITSFSPASNGETTPLTEARSQFTPHITIHQITIHTTYHCAVEVLASPAMGLISCSPNLSASPPASSPQQPEIMNQWPSDTQLQKIVMQSWARLWVPRAWGYLLGCCMPGLCSDQSSALKHEVM
jgi:hypothetical protein